MVYGADHRAGQLGETGPPRPPLTVLAAVVMLFGCVLASVYRLHVDASWPLSFDGHDASTLRDRQMPINNQLAFQRLLII
jgi:hypothetical protein